MSSEIYQQYAAQESDEGRVPLPPRPDDHGAPLRAKAKAMSEAMTDTDQHLLQVLKNLIGALRPLGMAGSNYPLPSKQRDDIWITKGRLELELIDLGIRITGKELEIPT